MFVVYWLELSGTDADEMPHSSFAQFDELAMADALAFMEKLRTLQRNGERKLAFITMTSQNPDAVGKAGAADPEDAYAWTKRRGNRPRARKVLAADDFKDY